MFAEEENGTEIEAMNDKKNKKKRCRHKECLEAGKQLCTDGHESCVYLGCNDERHAMAMGPGGWIPGDRIGNTD